MTHNTQPSPNPLESYARLRDAHLATHTSLLARRTHVLQLLAATLAAFLLLAFLPTALPGHNLLMAAAFAVTAALFIFLISRYLSLQSRLDTQDRLLALYTTAIARADGTEPHSGYTGPVPPPGHLYARDLDLFGPDSLFGLLATVRTTLGERGLAAYLLHPATHAETLARQQAVRELAPLTGLRERIALLGVTNLQRISATLIDDWLAAPPPTFPRALRPALILTSVASIILLRYVFFSPHPTTALVLNLIAVLAVQSALCHLVRAKVSPLLATSARLQQSIRLFAEGLALLETLTVTAPKLVALQAAARQPAGAVAELKRLQSLLAIVEQRGHSYFLPLSLLTAAGTQVAISLARWKHLHAPAMHQWLNAWSDFEALNALATFAFEHPANNLHYTWPTLLPNEEVILSQGRSPQSKDLHRTPPHLEATRLAHPLLPNAIPNNIAFTPESSFYLISGSNMAGKSTLLRAIGINCVLAYAGAPVRAASFALTPLHLGASLALTDSLAEGRSKFLAEVQRLAAIAHLSATQPVLFLVDEIFSGTNSADRLTAAAAVLNQLLAHNAIGALSTHDLALTELATEQNRGQNVHMASPNPEDPLAFDYTLKPGINTSSNALAIIRLLGLRPPRIDADSH